MNRFGPYNIWQLPQDHIYRNIVDLLFDQHRKKWIAIIFWLFLGECQIHNIFYFTLKRLSFWIDSFTRKIWLSISFYRWRLGFNSLRMKLWLYKARKQHPFLVQMEFRQPVRFHFSISSLYHNTSTPLSRYETWVSQPFLVSSHNSSRVPERDYYSLHQHPLKFNPSWLIWEVQVEQ